MKKEGSGAYFLIGAVSSAVAAFVFLMFGIASIVSYFGDRGRFGDVSDELRDGIELVVLGLVFSGLALLFYFLSERSEEKIEKKCHRYDDEFWT